MLYEEIGDDDNDLGFDDDEVVEEASFSTNGRWEYLGQWDGSRKCGLCAQFASGGEIYVRSEYAYAELERLYTCGACDPRDDGFGEL